MKKFIFTFFVSTVLILNGFSQSVSSGAVFVVEDFEAEEIGELPKRWYNQKGDGIPATYKPKDRATYNYEIMEEDGNKFLRFEGTRGKHLNFPFVEVEGIDIYETPILSWRWRLHSLPLGGNEDLGDKNDSVAGIYVVFEMGKILFKKVPKSIKYTWSSTLPKGEELSKFFNKQKIVVVGTGGNSLGEWLTFEYNIVEDYRRLFDDDPPKKPLAILILSDADDTGSISKADYDDIMLKSKN